MSSEEPDSTSTANATAEQDEKDATTQEGLEDSAAQLEQPQEECVEGEGAEIGNEAVSSEADEKASSTLEQQEGSATATPQQPQEECNDEKVAEKTEAVSSQGEEQKASPLQEKIIRQVEFYFGDRNFPRDKFLQQAASADSDGWVPLTTLLTFNRLKALSSDAELIATALRKATAGIVEISEDGTKVRRHPDKSVPDIFAADFRKEVMDKSIYAKGFPEDTELDQIQEFMDQYGKVHYIQMRRTQTDKKFKGSIFAEFDEMEDAKQFVKRENVQFNGADLLVEWKSGYFKRKQEERKQRKEEAKKSAVQAKKEEEGSESAAATSAVKVSGCVFHFTGVGKDTSREDIREDLLPFGTVAFVDFERGQTEGYVRFREEGGAKRARDGLLERAVGGTGVAQLCGADTELRILEGTEEEQYWCKVVESGKERKGGGRRGGRGRGRGRGGGRGSGNFRKRRERGASGGGEDGDTNAPKPKSAKIEE